MRSGRKKILAVASSGGHWAQLQRIADAWGDGTVVYCTTDRGHAAEVSSVRCIVVPDANRWQRVRMARLMLSMAWLVLRLRPDVVITTGAAPGYWAIRFGKLIGARTIWIDSIANADELSMSGRLASRVADATLTQWPHLDGESGARYAGAVV
jgi:UDP-N-acetylglucosamine:LPS N-acetylglucosamine transferase